MKTSIVVYEVRDKLVEVGKEEQFAQDLQAFHNKLEWIGYTPVLGEPADILNGIVYSLEGDTTNATFSFGSSVPVAGYLFAGAKVGIKYAPDFMRGAGDFADDAFQIARSGGRHSGTYKNYGPKGKNGT